MEKKFFRIGAAAALLVLTVSVAVGCSKDGDEGKTTNNINETNKTIAVIAREDSHPFWRSVKSGAEDAGEKYGYVITFSGPKGGKARDVLSQQNIVQTALSDNVSAMVIATVDNGFADYLAQAYDRKIPVIQLDSGICDNDEEMLYSQNKNPVKSSVATCNATAAALVAENLYRELKEDIKNAHGDYVVGVIQHDETQTGKDRADGFTDRFKELTESNKETRGKVKVEKEVMTGSADNECKAALEMLGKKNASAIFMSSDDIVKQVYELITAENTTYDKVKFCGFDAGSKQIEWMKRETGPKLIGSVVQDSYQMGYKAVEQAVFAVEGRENKEQVSIAGSWWDKNNVDRMIEDNLVYEG